jgi:hypothetical protein
MLGWLVGLATATTLRPMGLEQLTTSSTAIVIGQAQGSRSHWNTAHTRIVTDVEFAVDQVVKGEPTARVVITQLGGEVDGVRMTVPGTPVFSTGEEALLFLWRGKSSAVQVTGLEQGRFQILHDPVTGARYVERRADGGTVLDLLGRSAGSTSEKAKRVTVEQMVEQIRAVMAVAPHGARDNK